MNKCSFVGRMGTSTKFFPGQGQGQNAKKSFISFSLAVKRPGGKKDQSGNIPTDWLDFKAFGKLAELINQYCIQKGTLVCIESCIATVHKFQDKTGNNRQQIEFLVNDIDLDVTFASNKGNGNNNGGGNNGNNVGNGGYNPNTNYNTNQNNGYNNNNNYNNNNSNNGYNNNGYNNNQGNQVNQNQNNYNQNNGNNFTAARQGTPPPINYGDNKRDNGDLPF